MATDRKWMEYIDGEVRALCELKGWGHQIRRKWSVREKPVADSDIDDYEWDLLPGDRGRLSDAPPEDFERCYYLLWFDSQKDKFVFQHDTEHLGMLGPHWERVTYTEIGVNRSMTEESKALDRPWTWQKSGRVYLSPGWLRDHLEQLTATFAPNHFSAT